MNLNPENSVIYQEIIDGYSKLIKNGVEVYIKHMDSRVSAALESIFIYNFDRVRANGVPTEKEALERLKKDGLWTEKNELEITSLKSFVDNLNKTKSKQQKISQIKMIKEQIFNTEIKINKLISSKKEMIGITAEDLAGKKRNLELVKRVLFRDEDLKIPYYCEDEMDDAEYLDGLFELYTEGKDRISEKTIKIIALSNFFINNLILCGDNIFHFFNKPVHSLTYNQSSLLHNGKTYINIFKEIGYTNIPFEQREDPEKLVEWFEVNKNAEDIKKNSKSGGLVGGTEEDKKALGLVSRNNDIIRELEKRGGSMDIYNFADTFEGAGDISPSGSK